MATDVEAPPSEDETAEETEQDEATPEPIEGPDEPEARAPRDNSQGQIEKAERANRNYQKRLRDIFGPETPLYDCTACDGLGVTFAPSDAGGVPADIKMAENLAACEHCNAYGFNETPSKNPDHATAVCTRCSGIGYIVQTTPAPVYEIPQPAAPAADTPVGGQWVPGRGFIPYGQTEPLPNTVGLA
jgi:hypothetical protein